MKQLALLLLLALTACNDEISWYTERVTCVVEGKKIIYEARRTRNARGFQWVSFVGAKTGIRSDTILRNGRAHGGNTIIEYSAAIPCTLEHIELID